MEQLTRKAYAKINLGLDVIRRREDGYHEVKMVMQTVGIYDVLTFERAPEGVLSLSTDSSQIPHSDDNLVIKAARVLLAEAGVKEGVKITLQKNIPVAAGMAGGSTDAAAVFWGLTELFGLSYTMEQLQEMGVELGADIPYCIMGGTALSEGIGEVLTPLPSPPEAHLVIAKPNLMISTKYVYENLHVERLRIHPDIDGMVSALKRKDLNGICNKMDNVLETVTEREHPVISDIKDMMKRMGAVNALMSGSGPTVFGVFEAQEKADGCRDEILRSGMAEQVYVTEFVTAQV